jgi:hypothetical protein
LFHHPGYGNTALPVGAVMKPGQIERKSVVKITLFCSAYRINISCEENMKANLSRFTPTEAKAGSFSTQFR